jgi:hypothetical protein
LKNHLKMQGLKRLGWKNWSIKSHIQVIDLKAVDLDFFLHFHRSIKINYILYVCII